MLPSRCRRRSELVFQLAGKLQGSGRYHLPTSRLAVFCVICGLSLLIAFSLTGNQIFYANWGPVDDWESFAWLGPGKNLPYGEIWNTLLTKTEVGLPEGRFRPSYYFLKMLEMATWGTNVHLWYLTRTLEFTVFIASVWWITSRFVGIGLGAILLIPILAMPFWSDIWARLGPSEAYGSGALGILLLGVYGVFAGQSVGLRATGATAITAATIILVGVKETFVPFAGLSVVLLSIACARRLLSLPVASLLIAINCAAGGVIILFLQKIVASAADANSFQLSALLTIARSSLIHALSYWGPVFLTAGLSLAMVERSHGQSLRRWATASTIAAAIFIFFVAMYVLQCVAYRSEVPLNMRYDFPRMLFVPMNYCLLSCYVAYMTRPYFQPRSNWIVVGVAILSGYLLIPNAASQFQPLSLPKATNRNIQKTSKFFLEVQSIASNAKNAPGRPIILETHEPWTWSYEPVFALSTYLGALGADNPVSIRMHSDDRSSGAVEDGFKERMAKLRDQGSHRFVPLAASLANMKDGCISVGINGPAVMKCTGFAVRID